MLGVVGGEQVELTSSYQSEVNRTMVYGNV